MRIALSFSFLVFSNLSFSAMHELKRVNSFERHSTLREYTFEFGSTPMIVN